MKYRQDIDGMRALAVVSVMLYHLNGPTWLPGGYVGVDIFFVISGFVVSASLAASSQRGFSQFLTEFYARRLARIAPALVIMLVVSALLATLFVPKAWLSNFSEATALAAFLGFSNWVLQHNTDVYFGPQAEFNPYTHTWSLGVEEQFYLVCPLLLFLWVRTRSGRGSRQPIWPTVLLVLLGVTSLVGSAWATKAGPNAAFYSIQFRFWELAAGAALFQLSTARSAGPTGVQLLATHGPWLGLALVGAVLIFADPSHFPFPWAIPVVAGTLLLLGGVHASRDHPVRRWFANSKAVWIGKRSYSLYLWHWPILVLMRWTVGLESLTERLVAALATFIVASTSYRLVELPLRHNAGIQAFRPAFRIAGFLMMVLIGRSAAQRLFWRSSSIQLSTVSRHKSDWYAENRMPYPDSLRRACAVDITVTSFHGGGVTSFHPQRCRRTSREGKLAVLGDSHATMYFPMLEELSAEEGVTVSVYTIPGCSYLPLMVPMAVATPGCRAFMQAASQQVIGSGMGGDMLFLPSLRQWRFGDQWASFESRDFEKMTDGIEARENRERAVEEATSWLRPFSDRGMDILFEAPTPIFRSPAFRCSDWFNASNPVCRGGLTQPRSYLERLRAPILAAMGRVAAVVPRVQVWDPFRILCPEEHCTALRDGRPLFFDGDHLSAFGNAVVYPSFKAARTWRF